MANTIRSRELLDAARRVMRTRHMSRRTEETYLGWMARFLRYADMDGSAGWAEDRHPACDAAPSSEAVPISDAARRFVEDLATRHRVSASTQNQAASAVAFLLREVVGCDAGGVLPRAKGRRPVPTVLSREECKQVLSQLSGRNRLVACLLYGSGLRLSEALSLRVKDVCFDPYRLAVRGGKGGKDRETLLPERAAAAIRRQIERVARVHEADLECGRGWARLPDALHRKSPGSGWELGWQYLFPTAALSRDPATGRPGRYHIHPSVIQRAVKDAVRRSGITRHATCHTFRHSFASHALRMGLDVRLVQELMGHKDLKTTQLYLHVQDRAGFGIRSPLDRLLDD